MTQIRWEDLTREHLDRYSRIEAVAGFDDETFREVVWEKTWLSSLTAGDNVSQKARTLFVRVPSVSDAWVHRIRNTIKTLSEQPTKPVEQFSE
jgi:hypothetical protein